MGQGVHAVGQQHALEKEGKREGRGEGRNGKGKLGDVAEKEGWGRRMEGGGETGG